MLNLQKIQINITINDLKIVTFVDFKVTQNVILVKFVIKHELRTKNKQLVLKLYSFDETRIKEDITQKLILVIRLSDKSFNVVFDVIDCVKNVFLRYL